MARAVRRLGLACLLLLLAAPVAAGAACRQALVLALDVSASVDEGEYALQLEGLAQVLRDPEIAALLLSQPENPVALHVFEWSGRFDQNTVIGWRMLETPADLGAVAAALERHRRPVMSRTTAIGPALIHAARLLESGPKCLKRTVDISGDGKHNDGERPSRAKADPALAGATVNALVIGRTDPPGERTAENGIAELSAYFRAEVIHGPDAFIETAIGFRAFQAAMKRKLLRELSVVAAAAAGNPALGGDQAAGLSARRSERTVAARRREIRQSGSGRAPTVSSQ